MRWKPSVSPSPTPSPAPTPSPPRPARPIDFAILDIGLPDMTGLDVCRRLRETSPIPVLFLTARDGEVDRILGLELGGDDYVTKPFSPREIVARVRAILRRSATDHARPATASRHLAGTRLPSRHARRCASTSTGAPLDLTAHEYKLLLVLMEKPGRVLHPRPTARPRMAGPRRGHRPHGGRPHQVDPRQTPRRPRRRREPDRNPPRPRLLACVARHP